MVTVERQAMVAYSAAKMYALVDDVESYPDSCLGAVALMSHCATSDAPSPRFTSTSAV